MYVDGLTVMEYDYLITLSRSFWRKNARNRKKMSYFATYYEEGHNKWMYQVYGVSTGGSATSICHVLHS